MSELLQRDFTKGEKYLDEYRELCKVETNPQMLPDVRRQAEEEQQRRLSNCLCLIAKGREQQGRLLDAFEAYQEYSVQGSKQGLIGALDNPGVKSAPEVWARRRITAMLAKATPEQRKPLEERLSQKYAEVKKKGNVEELQQFVDTFGSLSDAGREARLLLAERLMEDTKADSLLKAEMQLLASATRQRTVRSPVKPSRHFPAVGRKDLMDEASYCYRVLGRDFADVVVRDGKTGGNLYNERFTDKHLLMLPSLDEPIQSWPTTRKITVKPVEYVNTHSAAAIR